MANEDRVWTLARSVLQAVVDGYSSRGIGLPDRQYVSDTSVITLDCELLAVAVQRMYPGIVGQETGTPLRCNYPRSVELIVMLTRCVPSPDNQGNAPSTTAIEAAAQTILTDLWAVAQSVSEAVASEDVGRGCDSVLVGPSMQIPASGGLGGVQLRLAAQLTLP